MSDHPSINPFDQEEQPRLLYEIEGAGDKGGGGDPPEEDPDTLRSRSTAKIQGILCEGPIEGFAVSSTASVYLNGTPLETGGEANFGRNVNVQFRAGNAGQTAMPGFNDVRVEQPVGVKVTQGGGPTSVTTTSNLFTSLLVRIGVGSLFRIEDDGDIKGTDVRFRITVINNTGGASSTEHTIQGKSRGPVDFEYPAPINGAGPWTVRITRLTSDPIDLKFNNDLFFKAVIGVLDESFTYPGTALVGLTVSAEAFDSVPSLSVEVKGMKIRVPSNYNPDTRTYSGIWDGSFTGRVYCNNPAWVFYDLLINRRYGCRQFIDTNNIDKFALYEIARYCDELVSNGRGGREPRFTFNGVINNRAEAYEMLNAMAGCFRGMVYFANGVVVPTQDRPGRVVKLFSSSNVIQEVDESGNVTSPPFVYEGTGRKARKTVALVAWDDPDDKYKTKIEYVEDTAAILRYGYREIDVRGFGCTSQGQAQRIGRWTLLTNLTEKETVTFKVSAQGFFLMPGEIIEIADSDRSGGVAAGRCLAGSTTSAVNLDREVTLVAGSTYRLQIISRNSLPVYDGTVEATNIPGNEGRNVFQGPGTYTRLTVTASYTEAPEEGDVWFLRSDAVIRRKYRVVSVAEDDGKVTVLAVAHNDAKYTTIDDSTRLDSLRRSVASVAVTPRVSAGGIVLDVS